MKILLTGATGFIGKRLTKKLLQAGNEVIIIVREENVQKARQTFDGYANLTIFTGDLAYKEIIVSKAAASHLKDIESFVHLAALYDLNASSEETQKINVEGTKNIVNLALRIDSLKYFHYVSTYAVSGLFKGHFLEEQIDSQAEFADNYSRSKMHAELLIRNTSWNTTKIRIYRPGIVVGDSKTGEMDKIDGPYYFFKLFNSLSKLKIPVPLKYLPLSCPEKATLPLLPVDIAVDWLYEMITHPTSDQKRCYHLLPDEKILINKLVKKALKHFGLDLTVKHMPFPKLYAHFLPLFKMPKQLVPYMQSYTSYDQTQFKNDFPHLQAPSIDEYLGVLLKKSGELF